MTIDLKGIVFCYRCGGVVSVPEGRKELSDSEKCYCPDFGLEPKEQPGEQNDRD